MSFKKMQIFKKISFYLFILSLLGCLVLFLPYSIVRIETVKTFVLSIGVALSVFFLIIAWLMEGKIETPKNKIIIIISGLVPVVYLLSSFFSFSPYYSLFGNGYEIGTFGSVLVFYLLFLLSFFHFQEKNKIWYFLVTIFFGLILIFLHIILDILFVSSGKLTGFFSGVLFNNLIGDLNNLSLFLGIVTLLIICSLEFLKLKKILKIILFVFLFLSLLIIMIINLPLTWLLLGVLTLLVFVVINYSRLEKKEEPAGIIHKKFPFASLVVFVLSFVFLTWSSMFSQLTTKYIDVNNQSVRPSIETTARIFYESMKINPILGIGPNVFKEGWNLWQPKDISRTPFWNINFNNGFSMVSTLVSTTGLLGGIIFISFIFLYFYYVVQGIRNIPQETLSKYSLMISIVVSLYGWFSLLLYNANIVIISLTFISSGILISMLSSSNILPKGFIDLKESINKIYFIVAVVLIMILSLFLIGIYSSKFFAVINYSKSISKTDNIQSLLISEKKLIKAISFDSSDVYYRALSLTYLNQLNLFIKDTDMSEKASREILQSLIDRSLYMANMAIRQNQKSFINYVNLGDIYQNLLMLNVKDSYDGAKSAYEKAQTLAPHNPSILLYQAMLELSNNKTEESVFYINKALEIKPDYEDALYLLEQVKR